MRLWSRIERVLEQSVETSREVLDKARTGAKELGESAKELGEVGVLKFDVLQLERRSAKVLSKLGHEVYEAFGERGRKTLSPDAEGVKELLAELRDIEQGIDEKERAIAELRKSDDEHEAARDDTSKSPVERH